MAVCSAPVIDIVIRSYYKDFEWLGYCLSSIRKYASGFRAVIVVIPRSSAGAFRRCRIEPDILVECDNYRDDYLGQQITKLYADKLTNADFITHVDSDVVFVRTTHSQDLFQNGSPYALMTPYDRHARNAPWRIPWQCVTEAFMGRSISHNFMQMMPLTYPRWLYPAVREFAHRLHGRSLAAYVLKQKARGFSEFNALGAFAYHYRPEAVSWIDMSTDVLPKPHTRIFWSWGGMTEEIKEQIEIILNNRHSRLVA